MDVSLTTLAMQAASALDRTHHQDGKGPRTHQARQLLARWLDTREGSIRRVRAAIHWLRSLPAE